MRGCTRKQLSLEKYFLTKVAEFNMRRQKIIFSEFEDFNVTRRKALEDEFLNLFCLW